MARLQAKGETIMAYDPNVAEGPHLQSQIDYVRHACPGQARLMDELKSLTVADIDVVMANSDVVVVSHSTEEFRRAVNNRLPNIHVLDLARLFPVLPVNDANYQGIAW